MTIAASSNERAKGETPEDETNSENQLRRRNFSIEDKRRQPVVISSSSGIHSIR